MNKVTKVAVASAVAMCWSRCHLLQGLVGEAAAIAKPQNSIAAGKNLPAALKT